MNPKQDEVLEDVADRPKVNPSEGIALQTLAPLDTVCVQTRNSNYRIFLLEPKTGRALIEGGSDYLEPVDALVIGSVMSGSTLKVGLIGIGMRLEFWTDGKVISTSPVQSFHVETYTAAESIPYSYQ